MLTCPECGHEIPLADVNVRADLALCRKCEQDFSYLELREDASETVDLDMPPKGAWYEESSDGVRLGATTRSWAAWFLVPFTLTWTGGSLGICIGIQILAGEFSLIASLVGLAFFAASIFLIKMSLMATLGKIKIHVDPQGKGVILSGVGPFGRRNSFSLAETNAIGEEKSENTENHCLEIVIRGTDNLRFGMWLSEERRYFLLNALRALLREYRQRQPR